MSKKTNIRFKSLPQARQMAVAGALRQMFAAGGKYHAVEGEQSRQRAPALVEMGGEDDVLPSYRRHKITNLMRQEMRNSSTARTIDQQRRVNVVGLKGGKLTLTFPDAFADSAAAWQEWFNMRWAPQAEFTDGMHFNELLKLALSSGDNGGDLTLMFDSGMLANTGRIRVFECDEHANLNESAFKARFGARGWRQSQGRIYDRLGRACGVIVSTSQRGRFEFDADKCFTLLCDPMADRRENFWTMLRRTWRFNQGRGISPLSAAITTLVDLNNIVKNETQATNLNAKLLGQILDTSDDAAPEVPREYDPNGELPLTDADGNALTDEEQAEIAAAAAAATEEPEVSFENLEAVGAMFDLMPPKLKMELLDTKRPNEKVQEFINWLSGNVTGVYGLGRVYATLNPEASYTAFRGAQCLSWPSIEESQKDLERTLCDWAGRNAFRWAMRERLVDAAKYPLPEGWENMFSWAWPKMREVNEVDAETAMEKKLSNRTTNYRATLGPNWRSELDQSFAEEDYFAERGKLHPAQKMVGGTVANIESKNRGKDTEE